MTTMNTGTSGGLAPHRGTLILVFGILGLVVCAIFGIVAWVMGRSDLQKMKDGQMDPSGESVTKTGMILGIITCCLQILAFLFFFLLVGGLGVAGAAAGN
jgi:hypothetical protein